MAEDVRVASVYAETGFKIDSKSWKTLTQFENRIASLKKKLEDLNKGDKTTERIKNEKEKRSRTKKEFDREAYLNKKHTYAIIEDNKRAEKSRLSTLAESERKIKKRRHEEALAARVGLKDRLKQQKDELKDKASAAKVVAKDRLKQEESRRKEEVKKEVQLVRDKAQMAKKTSLARLKEHRESIKAQGRGDNKHERSLKEKEKNHRKYLKNKYKGAVKTEEAILNKQQMLEHRMRRSGTKVEGVREANKRFSELASKFRGGKISAGQFNRELKDLNLTLGNQAKKTKGLMSNYNLLRRSVVNLSASYGALSAVAGVTQAGKGFEGAGTMMGVVFGKGRAEEMKFLTDESQRLGVNLLDSVKGYAKVSFAARKAGATLQETRDIYSSFSEAAVVMGTSQDDLAGIFKAIMQSYSKSTVQAEEIKGQMAERLPGAWQFAAEAMGMTTEVFERKVTARLIKAKDLMPAMAAGIRKAVAGELPQALTHLERSEQRLINTFDQFKRVLFEAGLGDSLREIYDALGFVMENSKGIARVFGTVLKPAIDTIIRPFKLLFAVIHDIVFLMGKATEKLGVKGGLGGLLEYLPQKVALDRGLKFLNEPVSGSLSNLSSLPKAATALGTNAPTQFLLDLTDKAKELLDIKDDAMNQNMTTDASIGG